jgi:hypothetical protein
MWQRETFDPATIDQELGWARSIGFTSIRVFLHDLLWTHDREGYLDRVDHFLRIAQKHQIGVMFVLFDSVWHPFPRLGKQREPEPFVHNSCWLQSPGVAYLRDEARFDTLADYVTGFIAHFRDDPRIHLWDLWNEPDNPNTSSHGPRDLGEKKGEIVARLIPKVFAWARAARPTQPLTTAVWLGTWPDDASLKPYERVQLHESDVISFHQYGKPESYPERIRNLRRFGRPIICSEFMARQVGSTFEGVLPVLKDHRVGAYCWGFVKGRTQTHQPWDSWQKDYQADAEPWFHEVMHPDGSPYRESEVQAIRQCAMG